jgi:hypothetical protein
MKSPFDNYDNIDALFRRELKEYQTTPPKGLWDKINAQLPVKRNPLPLYMAASVLIAALLAAGWWGINATVNDSKTITTKGVSPVKGGYANALKITSYNTASHSKNAMAQYVANGNGTTTASQLTPSKQKPTNIITVTTSTLNTNSQLYSSNEPTASVNLATEQVNQLQPPVEQLQNMPGKTTAGLLQPNLDDISYDNILQHENTIAPVTLNDRKIKGFYAGVNGSVNSVWILDHVALHDNNFDYQLTPGFTYGIQAGYNFSDNFGLETGVTINARDGQNYITYINSVIPVNKSVILNYTEIPVVAKFKIPQISAFTGMPVVLNLNIGASYGYLRHAYTIAGGDITHSRNQYPTNQVNALAGFSYDIYTNHPYSFSFGLMGGYGINTTDNDNQGGAPITSTPITVSRYANGSDFSSPHNLSIGINIAMNYNFSLSHH